MTSSTSLIEVIINKYKLSLLLWWIGWGHREYGFLEKWLLKYSIIYK